MSGIVLISHLALWLVVRRPPGAGALREDLHRLAAELLGAVDRRVDAAGGGDVRAEEHWRKATGPLRPTSSMVAADVDNYLVPEYLLSYLY